MTATIYESQESAGGPLSPRFAEFQTSADTGNDVRVRAVVPINPDTGMPVNEVVGVTMLSAVTTNTSGTVLSGWPRGQRLFQASISGTSGAVSATVKLYGSNDPLAATNTTNCAKQLLVTFMLSGTGAGAGVSADYGFRQVDNQWVYFWMVVENISGTGATVSGWGS